METTVLSNLKSRFEKLDTTILDKDAKDFFLRLPKLWLGDIERKSAPGAEILLSWIELQLTFAEEAIAKYGPNMRIVG